jgi:hypothetical protein
MERLVPSRAPISPTLVRAWLRYLREHPLEEWEVGPARNPGNIHQDPELALALDPDGVPYYWPARHPETLQRLTRETRRNWFVYWLAEELGARRQWLRRGARSYWRRMIAQALLLEQAQEEPWETPFPQELERSWCG